MCPVSWWRGDRASTSWRLLSPGCVLQRRRVSTPSRCPSSASDPLRPLEDPPPSVLHPDAVKLPRNSSRKTSLSRSSLHRHLRLLHHLLLLLLLLLHHLLPHCLLPFLLHPSNHRLPLRTRRSLSVKKRILLFQPRTCSNKILVRVKDKENDSVLIFNACLINQHQNVGWGGNIVMFIYWSFTVRMGECVRLQGRSCLFVPEKSLCVCVCVCACACVSVHVVLVLNSLPPPRGQRSQFTSVVVLLMLSAPGRETVTSN